MGNCVFKGVSKKTAVIRVVTPAGGVMELQGPIKAQKIIDHYPDHAIFSFSSPTMPLCLDQDLFPGSTYLVLPLKPQDSRERERAAAANMMMPCRMSVDYNNHQNSPSVSERDVNSPPQRHHYYNNNNNNTTARPDGVWKVRLAISSDQLTEIFSQEARTEALIQSISTVAKCASRLPSPVHSDQRSWTSDHN
ncbi:hypothetical protein OROMI_017463 [Orobanche minor]